MFATLNVPITDLDRDIAEVDEHIEHVQRFAKTPEKAFMSTLKLRLYRWWLAQAREAVRLRG
jgi:hypothetical protein